MKYLVEKSSSMFVISGGVKIAAAIVLCLWPVEDFTPLIYLFGIPAIIQGSSHIISAVYRRTMFGYWWVLFVLGVVYLTAGVVIIGYSDVTPVFLMVAIGITCLLYT